MKQNRTVSLRTRMVLLAMVGFLPLAALGIYGAWHGFEDAKAAVRADSLGLAHRLADRQVRDTEATRRLLEGLARVPALRAADTGACNTLLAQVRGAARASPYRNLTVLALNGDPRCSAEPLSRPADLARLPGFRDAAVARTFRVLGYTYSEVGRQLSLSVLNPVLDQNGQVVAFLNAELDLNWLATAAVDAKLPPGSTVALVDAQHKVLLRHPDPGHWVGRTLPDSLARYLKEPVDQLIVEPGLDGVARIHAGVPLVWNGQIAPWFTVSIPAAAAYAGAQNLLQISVGGLVLALMALVISWLVFERSVLVPLSELAEVARRIAAGDGRIRANPHSTDEIGVLATEFNRMVDGRRAEGQALMDSEALLSTMLDNLGQFASIVTPEGAVLQANAFAYSVVGLKPEDVVGKPFWETPWWSYSAEQREIVHEAVRQAAAGEDLRKDLIIGIADGRELTVDFRIGPVFDEAKRVTYLVASAIDITERRQAEVRLQEIEARLSKVLDNLPLLAGITKPDGTLLFVNSYASAVAGIDTGETIGKPFWETPWWSYSDESEQIVREFVLRAAAGEHVHQDAVIRGYDGRFLTVDFQILPVLDDANQVTHLVASGLDITKRKQAEVRLQESETRFRALVENTPDWIWEVDVSGVLTYNSPQVSAILGYAPEELIGRSPFDLMVGADVKRIGNLFTEIVRTGQPFANLEHTNLHRDGRTVILETSGAPIHGPNGELVGFHGMDRDITARKQAETQLRASEARLRAILDAEPECVKIIGPDGRLQQMNPAGLAMIEAEDDPAQVIGQKVDSLIVPEHRYAFNALTVQVLAGESGTLEFEIVGLKGTRRWLASHAVPLRDETTGVISLLAVSRDVTSRRLGEQALREKQEALSEAQRIGHIGSWSWRLDTGTIVWSEETYRVYGVSSDQFVLDPEAFVALVDPDNRPLMRAWVDDCVAGREPSDLEFRVTHSNGEVRVLSGRGMLERDADEQPVRLVGTVQDITERKALERELEQYRDDLEGLVQTRTAELEAARNEAERLTRVKSEFLANMSHEIRTPMNAVLGLARIGARDSAGRDSRETFARIGTAGEHLLDVINDILDYSKIEAGRLVLETQPFALVAAIDNLNSLVRDRAQAKGLTLSFDLEPGLPEWVTGDALRLSQILVNLLGNAIKFTTAGEVRMQVARQGERISFTVTDTGIGMTAQQRARLFQPFEQADSSTTRRFGGTGLGLAISQNLAREMGGQITVESAPGVGSSFTLCLPLPVAEPGLHKYALPTAQTERRLVGLRLLAAEDVEVNRLVLEDMLTYEGAHVVFAEHGQQALDRLQEAGVSAFDAVLMDVQMPVMDGYEATGHLRRLAPGLPVIGLTAHAMVEERGRCLAAGMVEHVAKPIDIDVLVAAILRHAGRQVPGTAPMSVSRVAGKGGPVDWSALLARYNGRQDFVAKLAATALTSHKDTPARLRQAVQDRDMQSLAFIAHALKGLAGNLVARGMETLARQVEAAARVGESQAAAVAGELANEVEALLAAVAVRLGETSGPAGASSASAGGG